MSVGMSVRYFFIWGISHNMQHPIIVIRLVYWQDYYHHSFVSTALLREILAKAVLQFLIIQ